MPENMCRRQWSSDKFRLHKLLPHHFRCFYCSNFKVTLDKNFSKKLTFFNFFQISTVSQIFAFRQSLAVNGYRKNSLNNSPNFHTKNFFLVYVNFRYMKYLIFAISSVCANCWFNPLMHNAPKWSDTF